MEIKGFVSDSRVTKGVARYKTPWGQRAT